MVIRVVIAVPQREYTAKLADYLREEEPGWDIAAFTHDSALRRELQEGRTIDLLIGQPGLLREVTAFSSKVGKIIALVVEKGDSEGQWQEISQYQSLPAILSGLRGGAGATMGSSHSDCQILTMFSASGGIGKTTIGINLIRQAAERGMRTFYLNLEALNATSLLFGRGEPDSLSRLLYTMQVHPEQWNALLEQLCRHQPQLRTDYLDAPDHPGERLALTSDLLAVLLENIRKTGRYDLILVDPDSGAGDWHRKLLEMSNRVIWIVLDDAQTLLKTEKLLRHWEEQLDTAMNKIVFVLNKGSGGAIMNRWSLPSATPPAMLPYIPQWKTIDQPSRLLASPSFSGAIDQLLDRIEAAGGTPSSKRRREEGHGAKRTHVRGAG